MPDYSSVLKSINARDDSLFVGPTGKPMFSHSKNHKRCIVLAEGFYEWRRRGKERVPFYTRRKDGCLMLMAGIYDVAQIQGQSEPLYTYATITTNASKQLEWLHDRMPVLISNYEPEKIKAWLDPKLQWNAALEAMLKPCDEYLEAVLEDGQSQDGGTSKPVYALETYQVDEKVNNVRNDSPSFATPWNASTNKKTLNRFFMPGTATSQESKETQDNTAKSSDNIKDLKTEDAAPEAIASAATTTAPTQPGLAIHPDINRKSPRRLIKMDSDDEEGDEAVDAQDAQEEECQTVLEQPHQQVMDEKQQREQEIVSVSADDDQRDAGFDEQEQQMDEEEEDEDLKRALEASRQEHEMNTSFREESPPLFLAVPDEQVPIRAESAANSATSTSGSKSSKSSPSQGRSPLRVDAHGSVDLLQKRKLELQKEEEDMKRVLELSRLEAIADGHDDPSLSEPSTSSSPQQSQSESAEEQQRRREQEELNMAIAASLQGSQEGGGSESVQVSSSRTKNSSETSPFLSQGSSSSSSSSTASSTFPTSPGPKKSIPGSPVASPKKRSSSAVSSPVSKKGKPNQASITSFFQQKSP
ncbi:hypothetical protein BGZ83_000195 [Gryganskiella cystojenkinii]|nr:hypothetical protein BGZ83_000195 [Gryganskiella cystojenkinii]